MGGYINAYTTHESTVVYNRTPVFYLEETTKMIYEIFQNSSFDKKEIELEKGVIINEIRSENEDAQEKVHEYFMENIFPGQSLGLPIIGTENSIINATRNDLYNFYLDRFNDNLSIIISGRINIPKLLDVIKKMEFRKKINKKETPKAIQGNENLFFATLPSEQIHLILGTSKFDITIENYIQIGLLNIILGESISSKFYQKIREELGLCYSIYTFFNIFRKENLFGLYVSLMPENVNKAIKAISKVIKTLLKEGIKKDELENAKRQKIGEIIMNSDLVHKRIQRFAFMDITLGKIFTHKETIDIINRTNIEDLNQIIKKLFIKDNFVTQVLYNKKTKIGDWEF